MQGSVFHRTGVNHNAAGLSSEVSQAMHKVGLDESDDPWQISQLDALGHS